MLKIASILLTISFASSCTKNPASSTIKSDGTKGVTTPSETVNAKNIRLDLLRIQSIIAAVENFEKENFPNCDALSSTDVTKAKNPALEGFPKRVCDAAIAWGPTTVARQSLRRTLRNMLSTWAHHLHDADSDLIQAENLHRSNSTTNTGIDEATQIASKIVAKIEQQMAAFTNDQPTLQKIADDALDDWFSAFESITIDGPQTANITKPARILRATNRSRILAWDQTSPLGSSTSGIQTKKGGNDLTISLSAKSPDTISKSTVLVPDLSWRPALESVYGLVTPFRMLPIFEIKPDALIISTGQANTEVALNFSSQAIVQLQIQDVPQAIWQKGDNHGSILRAIHVADLLSNYLILPDATICYGTPGHFFDASTWTKISEHPDKTAANDLPDGITCK